MGDCHCWEDEVLALAGSLKGTALYDWTEDAAVGQAAGLDFAHLEHHPKIFSRVQLHL